MKEYLYQLKLIPRLRDESEWTEEDEAIVSEHFHRLVVLRDQGIVLLAGKTDREGEDGFGNVIFQAGSKVEAEGIMNEDPAIAKGIMTGVLFAYRVAVEAFSK